jgi:hypothetical protein
MKARGWMGRTEEPEKRSVDLAVIKRETGASSSAITCAALWRSD